MEKLEMDLKVIKKTSKKGNEYYGVYVVIGEVEKLLCFLTGLDLVKLGLK